MSTHVQFDHPVQVSRSASACSARSPRSDVPYLSVARRTMAQVFGPPLQRRFAIRYWTGVVEPAGVSESSPFALVVASPGLVRAGVLTSDSGALQDRRTLSNGESHDRERPMYSTILVPLDGSAFAERAVPIAVVLARRSAATLELVHVSPTPSDAVSTLISHMNADDEAERTVRGRVTWLADRMANKERLPVAAVFLNGAVARTIQAHAANRGADLLVMSTHGRGGFSRAWLGSVADELVRRATAPLLLIKPGTEAMPSTREPIFRRVLIPLDGSARAEEVLALAAALGVPGETEYTLLKVVTPRASLDPFPDLSLMLDPGELERSVAEERELAREYLTRVADSFRQIGAAVAAHVMVDRQVASAILKFAGEHATDLIVLSTRVQSAFERAFVGSVADKVLRGAAMPLLMCGPQLSPSPSQGEAAVSSGVELLGRLTPSYPRAPVHS